MDSLEHTRYAVLRIYNHHVLQMRLHVSENSKEEVCGIVAGINGVSTKVYKVTNVNKSPSRFEMSPRELMEVFLDISQNGEKVIAFYHSHPQGTCYPSERDIHKSFYPNIANIIWAPKKNDWEFKAFFIIQERVSEIPVKVVFS